MPTLKIATLNIRQRNDPGEILDASELPWPLRKVPLLKSVLEVRPTIIGIQEAVGDEQKDDVVNGLKEHYDHLAEPIQAPDEEEYNVLCWDREAVELVDKTHFWLSETPDKPGTKSWGAKWTTMVIIGKFRLKCNNETLYVLNTHLDWHSPTSRSEAFKLIMARMEAFISPSKGSRPASNGGNEATASITTEASTPPLVFVVGDCNEVPDGAAYELITGGRYAVLAPSSSNTRINGHNGQNKARLHYLDIPREFAAIASSGTANGRIGSAGRYRENYAEDAIPTWEEYTSNGKKAVDPPMVLDHIFVLDNGALDFDGTVRCHSDDITSTAAHEEHIDGQQGRWRIDGFEVVENEFTRLEEDGKEDVYHECDDVDGRTERESVKYRYSDHRMIVASLSCA